MGTTSSETGQDQGVVGQASSAVQGAASTAQEKAGELSAQGKSRLSEQLDRRTTDVGSQAREMAHALRESSDRMRDDGNGNAAGMGTQVADQVERLGSYLEQKRGDEILRDVENLARRRPWMIAGVGLLAGIAASRFLKASSERRYVPPQGRYVGESGGYDDGSRSFVDTSGSAAHADADASLARERETPRV